MDQRRRFVRAIMMCVAAIIAMTGCSSDGADVPTTEELHGIWANNDGAMNRVFVFRMQDATHAELAGKTNVFMLHFYPVGDPAVVVQTGTYSVEERLLNEGGGQVTTDALVTRVLWDESGTLAGSEFGNAIHGWDGTTLVIAGSSGDRTYKRLDAVP